MDANNHFQSVIEAFSGDSSIKPAKMFGADGLKVNGKFFATFFKGAFVIKLPKERVEELVKAGKGEYFDPGMGKVMKEWVAIDLSASKEWIALAKESKDFVSSLNHMKH
jgi:TfoX/Sxy family transcriptional regulator of competence genes